MVRKLLIDPPLVENYLLQYFIREHVVDPSTGLNDFFYRPNELKESAINFALLELSAILKANDNDESWWWDELIILIKLTLPDGIEMQGNFCNQETVGDIKSWIFHRIQSDFTLGEAADPKNEFKDDSVTIQTLNLDRKRLIIKICSGDFGRAKMEETELKRKEENEKAQCERIEKYRKLKAEKDKKDLDKKDLRALTLKQFAREQTENRIQSLKI